MFFSCVLFFFRSLFSAFSRSRASQADNLRTILWLLAPRRPERYTCPPLVSHLVISLLALSRAVSRSRPQPSDHIFMPHRVRTKKARYALLYILNIFPHKLLLPKNLRHFNFLNSPDFNYTNRLETFFLLRGLRWSRINLTFCRSPVLKDTFVRSIQSYTGIRFFDSVSFDPVILKGYTCCEWQKRPALWIKKKTPDTAGPRVLCQ